VPAHTADATTVLTYGRLYQMANVLLLQCSATRLIRHIY
jgi:hypothetical protein